MKTALIVGATGLIGKQLLELLLHDNRYSKVKAITRKSLGIENSKLENLVINFDQLLTHYAQWSADDVFCCLGTTMRQAGSKEAFLKVDCDYPSMIAKLTKAHGARQYLLVSALGAKKNSSIYYNHVKGEAEESIDLIGFESYHIFRPSLLLGPRTENRAGEDAAKVFYKIFGFLMPLKYKSIDSGKVARAMLYFAKQDETGKHIHESGSLQTF